MELITNPADAMDRAADIIDLQGWEQHVYTSPEGVCVAFAITAACYDGPSHEASLDSLMVHGNALIAFRNFVEAGVIDWNDNVASSKEEVIKTLRDCASEIRNSSSELLSSR